MYRFTFVILHYMTVEDTIACIESLLKNVEYPDYSIVVVDNGSPNNTGLKLHSRYEKEKKVTVIINRKNLGFAKGNNVGFRYAKNVLRSDFIALINNDTIIDQGDFITLIMEKFEKSVFHILGPDIITVSDGRHQNPQRATLQNASEIKKFIKLYRIYLFLNYFCLDQVLERLKKRFFPKPTITSDAKQLLNPDNNEMSGVKLHGSALVFSPLYVRQYEGLYPKTFMYSEEAVLYYIARRDGLITVYFPRVQIYHKEDISLNSIYKKNYKKRRFYYRNFIHSGKVLLGLMKESRKKE